MHNVGQIVMAMIILHTSQLAYYMAVLMLSGILLRRADRRERHAGDEVHEAYQGGEIAKGAGATADFICSHAFLSPPQR